MTKKQPNNSDNNQLYDDVEYDFYCDALEEQYKQAKEQGMFEILRVLELDKNHSDSNLVKAIDYFNERNGVIEKDAPMNFLTEREKSGVFQERWGC